MTTTETMTSATVTAADVIARWADDWRTTGPYALAGHADCGAPDSDTSAGAEFLYSVRDAVIEAVEQMDPDDWNDDLAAMVEDLNDDRVHEIADAAPDVYTHTRWAEFVDLAAWQEDPTELGADASDMEATAGVCLYLIAERLARVILADLAEQNEQITDPDD